jgi:hypothetical protein
MPLGSRYNENCEHFGGTRLVGVVGMLDNIFIYSALIGGAVLAFQFLMMVFGLGHHGTDLTGAHGADFSGHGHFGGGHLGHDVSHDTSVSHDGSLHDSSAGPVDHSDGYWFYEMISLRTLSAAATFFGLAGKTMLAYDFAGSTSFILACVAGFAAMYCVYWLFKQVYRFQNTGTENIRNAIGSEATVYVPIPGKRSGAGKVTFRLQNRSVEYVAVTEDEGRLATGEKVIVVGIVNAGTVRVVRADTASPAPKLAPSAATK